MINWIRTSRLSIKNSLCDQARELAEKISYPFPVPPYSVRDIPGPMFKAKMPAVLGDGDVSDDPGGVKTDAFLDAWLANRTSQRSAPLLGRLKLPMGSFGNLGDDLRTRGSRIEPHSAARRSSVAPLFLKLSGGHGTGAPRS